MQSLSGTCVYGQMGERKWGRVDKPTTQVQQTSVRHTLTYTVTHQNKTTTTKKKYRTFWKLKPCVVLRTRDITGLWTNITSQPMEALPVTLNKNLPMSNPFSLASFSIFCIFFFTKTNRAIFFLHFISMCNVKCLL